MQFASKFSHASRAMRIARARRQRTVTFIRVSWFEPGSVALSYGFWSEVWNEVWSAVRTRGLFFLLSPKILSFS